MNRTFRLDMNSPKGWLAAAVFFVVGGVLAVLFVGLLLFLLPAALITGFYLRWRASRAPAARRGPATPPRAEPGADEFAGAQTRGDRVIDVEYEVR